MKLNHKLGCISGVAVILGLMTLSVAYASVPSHSEVTNDTALYQNLSEIRVSREANPNFDKDIEHLAKMEDRYRENLPLASNRMKGPMQRIAARKYRYTSKAKTVSASRSQSVSQ